MSRRPRPSPASRSAPGGLPRRSGSLRIIGGRFRGRSLRYLGDPRTRPMKDRVREAVFNLIGPAVLHKHVLDLFAGTGALGLEAISRGAARATLIERHFPTVRAIQESVAELGAAAQVEVVAGDAFVWASQQRARGHEPWLVFCSPPYDFYVRRDPDLYALLETLSRQAPAGSLLVVEGDRRLDVARLPGGGDWTVRSYPPAVIALGRAGAAEPPADDAAAGDP